MQTENNKCKEIEFNLDAFHDGELNGAERTAVETHLQSCPSCVAKLAEIDRVVHTLKTMPRMAASTNLSSKLDNIIDQQTKVVPLHRKLWKPAAAVAAVAAIFVAVRFGMPTNDHGTSPTVAQKETTTSPTPAPIIQKPIVATHPVGADLPVSPHHAPITAATPPTTAPNVVAKSQPKNDEPVSLAAGSTKNLLPHSASPTAIASITPTTTNTATAVSDSETLAELPTITDSFSEAIGIATDEDGLYDIKM